MEQTERFHALDALRAFALLLGIVLHATMSFLPGFGDLGWPIADNSPSTLLGVCFYVIHFFRMTFFFLIGGFFARLLFHRLGRGAFFKERAKRLLIPLVVGWIILTPLLVAAMFWGASQLGRPLVPPRPPSGALLPFPLTHLWFLWLLFWLYVLAIGGRRVLVRMFGSEGPLQRRIDALVLWLSTTVWGPLLLALPLAVSLYRYKAWLVWAGIPTPDQSLIPNLPALLAYGTAFVFGWLLHRQAHLLRILESRWAVYLAFAIALSATCIYFGGSSPKTAIAPPQGVYRMAFIAGYCVAVWCWTFALIGAAMHFFSAESTWRRYLSDSSYWLYLVHLPLIFALQAWMMRWDFDWSVKFPVILTIAVSILLLSYHFLVRSTFVGVLLNGRRYPRLAWRTKGVTA